MSLEDPRVTYPDIVLAWGFGRWGLFMGNDIIIIDSEAYDVLTEELRGLRDQDEIEFKNWLVLT